MPFYRGYYYLVQYLVSRLHLCRRTSFAVTPETMHSWTDPQFLCPSRVVKGCARLLRDSFVLFEEVPYVDDRNLASFFFSGIAVCSASV